MGYSRIIKWCYLPISISNNQDLFGPDVEVKKNEIPRTVLEQKVQCTSDWFDSFIGSLLSTIAAIMTERVNKKTIEEVDREIKIYLTNVHVVYKEIQSYNSSNKNPIDYYWLKKYNFLSLLNIPKTMERYGPLINLWEGSNQGEGYLRYVKPKITDIHSRNWQVNAHINLLNETSMNRVILCHVMNKSSQYVKDEYIKHIGKKKGTGKKCFIHTNLSTKYCHSTEGIDLYLQ